MRGGRFILLLAALLAAAVPAAGCSFGTDASEETSGKPVIIDFWRPGCQPCEVMEPTMEQLKEEYGDQVEFKAYNTQEERSKSSQYGIEYVPTFLFINEDGVIVDRVVGQVDINVMRESIEELLSNP